MITDTRPSRGSAETRAQLGPIPADLVRNFAEGNGTLFVGAGLSMGAGYPSWAELLEPLYQGMQDLPPNARFPEIADYLIDSGGPQPLMAHLARALPKSAGRPTEAHSAVLALAIGPNPKHPRSRIFTTNFDNLIERAATNIGAEYLTVRADSDLPRREASVLQIVKVHGDLENAETVVIASRHYERIAATKPGILGALANDLRERTVLFLGYSFNDDDLKLILSEVVRQGGPMSRPLYALHFADHAGYASVALRRFGIQIVKLREPAPGEDRHDVLVQWLEHFEQEIRRQRTATRSTLPHLGPRFFGREDEIAQVLEALRGDSPVTAIVGGPGVGKRSLAVKVFRSCAGEHDPQISDPLQFDHAVWLSGKEIGAAGSGEERLRAVLRSIHEVAGAHEPVVLHRDLPRATAAVRYLLAVSRVLVAFDDFDSLDDEHVRAWLGDIPAGSKVLVTAGEAPAVAGVARVPLTGLSGEDALPFIRAYGFRIGLPAVEAANDQDLLALHGAASRNPQVLRLALGQVDGAADLASVTERLRTAPCDGLFDHVLQGSWVGAGASGQAVLRAMAVFAEENLQVTAAPGPKRKVGRRRVFNEVSVPECALQAAVGADLDDEAFRAALERCLKLGLVDRATGGDPDEPTRYVVHGTTLAFVYRHLASGEENEIRRRISDYARARVSRILREQPDRPYWNALVTSKMRQLDPDWHIMRLALDWTGHHDHEAYLELVLRLVHYMDSRFHNRLRLHRVKWALGLLEGQGRWEDEALLRMDALGWTYVEEGDLEAAAKEIAAGLALAEAAPRGQARNDLLALGRAWQARVRLEEAAACDGEERTAALEEARTLALQARKIRGPSLWIQCRVFMAAGEVAMGREQYREALEHYENAACRPPLYGGEGGGYQTLPRLGLAYLKLGRLNEAEDRFKELLGLEDIAIGLHCAEFGLALVQRARGEVEAAQARIDRVRAALQPQTSTNLLLKMIDQSW